MQWIFSIVLCFGGGSGELKGTKADMLPLQRLTLTIPALILTSPCCDAEMFTPEVSNMEAWSAADSSDTLRLPNPRIAASLSAVLPGAGQIYNRSFWKAPIVWGVLGITGYLAYRNHQQYLFYKRAYKAALQGQDPLPPLRPENIRLLRESYRQDRDIFVLAFLIGYGLQIGEAFADAHLKGFTIYAGAAPSGLYLAIVW
ncbi:MAG: DUF5683 domain-containing protein [Bacteroidia bacterium]|nr:DUF5683 domain-containing protein [Bacteroidia bacterium]